MVRGGIDDGVDDDDGDDYDDRVDDDDDEHKDCKDLLPGSMRIVVLDEVDPEAVGLVVNLLEALEDGVTLDALVIVCTVTLDTVTLDTVTISPVAVICAAQLEKKGEEVASEHFLKL